MKHNHFGWEEDPGEVEFSKLIIEDADDGEVDVTLENKHGDVDGHELNADPRSAVYLIACALGVTVAFPMPDGTYRE